MRWPQFSLASLGAIVALTAVACCALVYASDTWAVALFTSVILFLAFATVAAIYRESRARAYWLCAAVFGWLYLLLIFGPFSGTRHLEDNGRLNEDPELATARVARWAYQTVLPKLRQPPPPVTSGGGFFPSGGGGTFGPATGMSGGIGGGEGMLGGVGGMPGGMTGSGGPGVPVATTSNYPNEPDFMRVSQAIWTWLSALIGGALGTWLYASRESRLNRTNPPTILKEFK